MRPREIQPNFAPVTSTAWNSIANLRRCQPFSPETVADKFAALPIGTASCAIFREKIALRHPALIGWFTHVYQSRNALLGLQAANAAIRTIDQRLSISGELGVLRFSGDDQFVDTFAQRFADHTGKLVSTRAHVVALQLVVELAHHYGLRPVDTITEEQALDPIRRSIAGPIWLGFGVVFVVFQLAVCTIPPESTPLSAVDWRRIQLISLLLAAPFVVPEMTRLLRLWLRTIQRMFLTR